MNIHGLDLMVIGYGLYGESDSHVSVDYSQFHQHPIVEVHIRRGTTLEAAARALRNVAECLPDYDRKYQKLREDRVAAIRSAAQKLAEHLPHDMDARDRGQAMSLLDELLSLRRDMDIPLGDEDGLELEKLGL
jgi:hypothetical protein